MALQIRPCAVLAYSDFTIVDGVGGTFFVSSNAGPSPEHTLRMRCPFMPSATIASRKVLLDEHGFDVSLRGCEDWDMWFRLIRKYGDKTFVHVPENLTYYSLVPGSLSTKTHEMFEQSLGLVERRLLDGLTGLRRRVWRRKILARIFRDAAVVLRAEGEQNARRHIIRSLEEWPFPDKFIQSDRYKIAARMIMLRQ